MEVNLEEKEEGKRKEKEEEGHQKGKRKANKENNILSYNMGFFSKLLCWLFKGSFCKFNQVQLIKDVTQKQLEREQERQKNIGGKRRRKTRRKK